MVREMGSSSLVWIRRDLRLTDHAALAEATAKSDRVAVVFVFDRNILDELQDLDDRRLTFIHQSLREVDERLQAQGSRLIVLDGDPVDLIPALVRRLGVDQLLFNGDVEPYALIRDNEIRRRVPQAVVRKDHVVFARREVVSQAGEPFKVYTPYSKAWKTRLTEADWAEKSVTEGRYWSEADLSAKLTGWEAPFWLGLPDLTDLGFVESDLWLEAGESGAQGRLEWFRSRMKDYADQRDLYGVEGTSGLSVHLRHGTISVRECVRAALSGPGKGAEKWLNELIWREFYQMILSEFPHVVSGCFKPEFDALEWPGDPAWFEAWAEGRTGYPIVDAAMRCFNATGWMHNRLRMVVAMFLTKDLLLDWRLGEAYFARYLLDFDLASNSGGWQWSASVGVDAQPYFRIFNPILQSRKFDPEGAFIKRWVPELRDAADPHWPGLEYLPPIVDHAIQKDRAVKLLESVVKSPARGQV